MTKVQFRNEDCFKTMELFVERGKKVNIILTSPPYNTARNVKTQKARDTHNGRYDDYSDNMSVDEYCDWTVRLFNSFNNVLAENGVILYNISYGSENPHVMWLAMSDIIRKTDFMIADTIIWKKRSALPNNVSPNKLTRITEFVFVLCRKDEFKTFHANKKISGQSKTGQNYYECVYNFIEAPNNDGSCKLNKATYSSELCEKLLDIYAKSDYVVYDPFMGTGTTAIGCMKYNGRENDLVCVGSEISPAQVEYSKQRLEEFRNSTKE